MRGSMRILRVFGIDVRVHWTFLLLIFGIIGYFLITQHSLGAGLAAVVFVLCLFTCVVLHELGHATVALRFGVKTRDITLLPIGGLARLQRMPDHPFQEFLVALAGPAVNVVIAGVLAAVLFAIHGTLQPDVLLTDTLSFQVFLPLLMWANILLVLFNMLPAFPMDGGRALRAILAMTMNYTTATDIAARLGQVMAVLFGLWGLVSFNPILLFIALFVYLGAEGEARMVHVQTALEGVPLRDAMQTHFRTLSADDSLQKAVTEMLTGPQKDFPVMDHDQFCGMLFRDDIVKQLQSANGAEKVGDLVHTDCRTIDDREMLDSAFRQMSESHCATLPVMHAGQLAGLITLDNVGHFIRTAG